MMKTTEVVNAMAEITGGTKKDAKVHFDAFKEVIVSALTRGEDVELKGLASFVSKEVAQGTGRNPQTGEAIVVPAHRKASAKLAKSLRKF